MKLVSLNIGLPAVQMLGQQEVMTGIIKKPVESAFLRLLGFEGDGSADLKNHGGLSRAVCGFAFDHYPYWEDRLHKKLSSSAFGENLTLVGALDTVLCLGDIYQLGKAVVQITQPRQPCGKVAKLHGVPDMVPMMNDSTGAGFYLRVIEEGLVRSSDEFTLRTAHPARITLAEINDLLLGRVEDQTKLAAILAMPELGEGMRQSLSKKVKA